MTETEILKIKKEAGIEAIKMIAQEEAWEESEEYYIEKWKNLMQQL